MPPDADADADGAGPSWRASASFSPNSSSSIATSASAPSSSSRLEDRGRFYSDYENYDAPAIVDLTMVEAASGVYYTMPVKLGDTTYNLMPDTGSSDIWVAGSSCRAAACTDIQMYTPTDSPTAHDANQPFTIDYVIGSVSGEIYWEEMTVAGRTVPYQAMAAASDIQDEDMYGGKFSGVIGLALPGNSIINDQLASTPWALGPLSNLEIPPPPPPDGIDLSTGPLTWSRRRKRSGARLSALGSDPPSEDPPPLRPPPPAGKRDLSFTPYISMSLSRPSAPTVPSKIGFDTHLTDLCPAECSSNLAFTNVIESALGVPLFWRAPIQEITVTDGTTGKNTSLTLSASALDGQAWPVGVLDSGAMGIYTSNRNLLNAIYGSADIHPGEDGNYYMPCTTAINITIVMSIGSFPIHPLDVSDLMSSDPSHQTCLGALQYTSEAALAGKGDIILGAAFMRNVYTVLSGPTYTRSGTWTTPQLSLLALTDPVRAAEEFHTVRVLNQNIPTSTGLTSSQTSAAEGGISGAVHGNTKVAVIAGLSVAAVVLVAVGIFVTRFLLLRRKLKKQGPAAFSPSPTPPPDGGAYPLADAASGDKVHAYALAPKSPGAHSHVGSARTTTGSIGSSTAASSYFDTADDDEKAGIASHARRISRQRGGPGTPKRQTSSLMGGGYEDVDEDEDGKGGLTGSYAPWSKVEDPEEEQAWDMARISSHHDLSPDAAVPVLNSGWRIQDSSPRSTRSGAARSSTASADQLSPAQQLLKNKRDARRSRTESPASVDRASRASSSTSTWTLSSTSTLPAGVGNTPSGSQHSYPPPPRTASHSSLASGSSSRASPPPPTRDRPLLRTFASTRTPGTIVESPTASPVDNDCSLQSLIPPPLAPPPAAKVSDSTTQLGARRSSSSLLLQSPFQDSFAPRSP